MSPVIAKQLKETEEILLTLSYQELEDFIEQLLQRYKNQKTSVNQKKLNYLSPKIRKEIRESLKEHEMGKGSILCSQEEIDRHFDKLEKEHV